MKSLLTTTILAGACWLTAGSALAQLAIPWHTIDGGGGTSGVGGFSLITTIGQADAGPVASGGDLTLTGGFLVSLDRQGPPPTLTIRRGPGGTVILSWPNPSTGYVLEQATSLGGSGSGWTPVTQTPVVNGGMKEVTLPAAGFARLFRLRGQ